jgi:hypothetical protein
LAENDEILERIIHTLKEPVEIDPGVDRRVMAAIEADTPLAGIPDRRPLAGWLSPRWTIRLSPVSGLAAAAGLAALALAASMVMRPRATPAPAEPAVAELAATGAAGEIAQFVLVAPDAESVTLVGDFNDWSLSATRLARQSGDGVWWVTVPLPPGRYRYAFVVNGTGWRSDPNAPAAEDEFGRPNSVVTIGGV